MGRCPVDGLLLLPEDQSGVGGAVGPGASAGEARLCTLEREAAAELCGAEAGPVVPSSQEDARWFGWLPSFTNSNITEVAEKHIKGKMKAPLPAQK